MGRCTLKQHSVDASIVLCNPFPLSQDSVMSFCTWLALDGMLPLGWNGMGCWHVAVQLLAAPIMLFIIIFQFNTVPPCVCMCLCVWIVSQCLLAQTSFDKVIPIVQFRFDGLAVFAFSSIHLSQPACQSVCLAPYVCSVLFLFLLLFLLLFLFLIRICIAASTTHSR